MLGSSIFSLVFVVNSKKPVVLYQSVKETNEWGPTDQPARKINSALCDITKGQFLGMHFPCEVDSAEVSADGLYSLAESLLTHHKHNSYWKTLGGLILQDVRVFKIVFSSMFV